MREEGGRMKAEEGNKGKAIDMAMTQIEKLFGKGAIMKLGERPIEDIPVVSTGSIGLNIALGIGGVPRGRVIEIFGPEALRKDDARPSDGCRGAEAGRLGRIHRCGACPGRPLCEPDRRQRRRPSRLAARHGRAGPGDYRNPRAERRRRHSRHRLGGGPRAAGGD